jgi:hypothetical protein
MDESLIMEIWDTFREYIPEKHKDTAANQYVDFLLGKDVEISVLEGFIGYDPHLDDAIRNVVDEANSLDSDEDDNFYEDDEDY